MACEKCWGDAYFRWRFVDGGKSQSEHYRELLEERKDAPCTPDEQAGSVYSEDSEAENNARPL